MRTSLKIVAFVGIFIVGTAAQDVIPSNSSGEFSSHQIDVLATQAREMKERVYVISRRGTRDTRKQIEFKRLALSRVGRAGQSFDSRTVYAVGLPVEGEGRLEWYLGSELKLVVLAPKNQLPRLTCCDEYIPPRKNIMKIKN